VITNPAIKKLFSAELKQGLRLIETDEHSKRTT